MARHTDERTNVERWMDQRMESRKRNRKMFLFVSALFLAVFSSIFVDSYLVAHDPVRESFFGFPREDVSALMKFSRIMAAIAFVGLAFIVLFWRKKPV